MNMEKNTEDYQIENMLENWQKKSLDNQALLAAQSRVWSKIESKLSNSNLVSKNILNPIMSDNQNMAQNHPSVNQSKSVKPWYLRPLTLSISGMAIVLIAIAVSGMVYLNQQKKNPFLGLTSIFVVSEVSLSKQIVLILLNKLKVVDWLLLINE